MRVKRLIQRTRGDGGKAKKNDENDGGRRGIY